MPALTTTRANWREGDGPTRAGAQRICAQRICAQRMGSHEQDGFV